MVVVPFAIKPAITSDAPALKSVALTVFPVNLVGPTITAFWFVKSSVVDPFLFS